MNEEYKKQVCWWLNYLKIECGTWAEKTFPKSTPASCIEHLKEEVGELSDNVNMDRYSKEEIAEELADNFLLLIHLAYKKEIDIGVALIDKFEKNQSRVWETEPNEKGYYKHKEVGARNTCKYCGITKSVHLNKCLNCGFCVEC